MGRPKPPTTDLSPSNLPSDHILVQLGPPKGSNNFASIDPEGVARLVAISSKIRKSVIATRGDFAIVKLYPPGPEDKEGALAGEIIFVASPRDVKDWKRSGEWPEGFGDVVAPVVAEDGRSDGEEDGGEDVDEVEGDEEHQDEGIFNHQVKEAHTQ